MHENMAERKIGEYIEALAGEQSMPGGGSAAGVVAGFAAALAEMMGSLTKEPTERLLTARQELASLRTRALLCGRDDEISYGSYLDALLLPKSTPEEKTARKAAMNSALERSARVPLELARIAVQIVDAMSAVIEDGNKTVMGDARASMVLAQAVLEVCLINVNANLPYIKDTALAEELRQEMSEIQGHMSSLMTLRQAQIAARMA